MDDYEIIYSKDRIMVGKYNYFVVLSKELPKTINFGILKDFLTSNHSIDISINVLPMDDSKMIELFDIENETLEPELKYIKDFSSKKRKLERKILSTRALEEYVISGKGHIYRFSLSIYSKSESEEKAKNSYNYVIWELKKNLFSFMNPIFELKNYFYKLLPIDKNDGKNSQFIHTHALGTLFPFLVDYVNMENGIFYGINDKNYTPVIFNRWEFPSSHSIISGTTGFGKSYFVKLSIIRELILDRSIRIYIIDPLGEYTNLVKMLGGEVVKIGMKGNEINIFELGNEKNIEEKILRLRTLFSILLDLTKNDLALIDAALTMIYLKEKEPTISDFIDILKTFNDERSIEISYLLDKLISGSLKSLDSKTFLKLDKNIVSFDLTNINDEFMTFYMTMILDFIYGKISSDYEKKLVIIDETWKLLKNEYASAFIDTLFRHVRRWKCSMNVISQKADDFLTTPFGRSIMNNALFHIIFKHGYISDEMQSFYKFTNAEENFILNVEKPNISGYSQAYFISHPLRFPLRIIATREENEVITTNPDELKKLKNI